MKYSLLVLFIAFVCAHASYYHEELRKVGFVQPLIVDAITQFRSDCNYNKKMTIKEKQNKTLECLAEIKSNNSFCYTFVQHFERCTKPLVDIMEECVEPMLQGAPTALVQLAVAQVRFICNSDGEHILEIFNPCIYRILFRSNEDKCYSNLREHVHNASKKNDTKIIPVICKEVREYKTCSAENFKNECQNDITRSTLQEIYNGLITPCKDNNII